MDDFSTPGTANAFGLWPSPCELANGQVHEMQFCLPSTLDNYPEPGKRPLSSTTPTIIEHEDGSFWLAIGGSGGSRIFGSVFQVILNLGWGMDVSAAVEYGRLHDQLFPSVVDADDVYPRMILDGLREKGHNVTGAHVFAIHRAYTRACCGLLADTLIAVSDINRIAAVVQAVVQEDGVIYGTRLETHVPQLRTCLD